MFKTAGMDPYLVSHPFPNERIANLETTARKSPYWDKKDPPALQARHDLMRAKLFGFTARADEVGRRYPLSDMSAPARYARAIAAYRNKQLANALSGIDSLTREQPNNPYFWELRGQVLLEFGRAQEAVTALRRAVSLAPSSGLIKGMLGHALISTGNPKDIDAAIAELSNAAQREPESSENWRFLATAYSRKGQEGQAHLAAAQAYFNDGDYSAAATQANRAKQLLPPNSPGWLKAEDILNYRPPRSAQRNN
jgi:predicted Zn-dependent protease